MPIYLKNNPESRDLYIQGLQKYLYKNLKRLWAVDDTNFQAHGRCYRNANNRGYVPELFNASAEPGNTQYTPLVFNKDNDKALFFFSIDDRDQYRDGESKVPVSLIFIVDLSKLRSTISHRADEETMSDVRKLCVAGFYQLSYTGTETGFKNVFKTFDGLINKDGEVFEDRHPLFCFKINLELMYQPGEVIC